MGRPTLAATKDTKAELIQAATALIQTRGYNAFSYQDLAEQLAITKASIHYHFPSKEALGVALIDASVARLKAWQAEHSDAKLSALTRMEAYFDYFAAVSASGTKVCACGALAAEWGSLPLSLQDAVGRLFSQHREWIRHTLDDGRRAGEVVIYGTSEEQAQFVFASIQGVLQTSRIQRTAGYFRAVTRQLLAALTA